MYFICYLSIISVILLYLLYATPNFAIMEIACNEFTNGEITVTFAPNKCTYAEKCAKGLSSVFRMTVIPWINLEGSETKEIISQIRKCPSGALNFCRNDSNTL